MKIISKDILKELYPPRPFDAKKYDYGLVLIIGGGEFYSGSPALASFAAFRAGVDMVRVVAPKRAADIIASFSPTVAAFPLEGAYVLKKHLAQLLVMTSAGKDTARGNFAVAIGGGLGRSPEILEVVAEYLSEINVPAVIDGDAIYAISKNPLAVQGKPFIITPNTYEFSLLGGSDVRQLSEEGRIQAVQNLARTLTTTILLKFAVDIISDGNEIALNKTGSPYMTVGGSGDTLSGVAAALLARRVSPFKSASGAAYINGKAGEIAAERFKESMVATDIIEAIPEVLN